MASAADAYRQAQKRSQSALADSLQKLQGGQGALAYVASVRRLCQCGHPVLLHDMNPKKIRTWCSYMDPAGRCPCKRCETPDE